MLPEDAYNAKLQQTIASLEAWVGFVADVARVSEKHDDSGWRLSLLPRSVRACPIEIVLRPDQHYDLTIAGVTYQNRPIASFDMFLPLVEAVAEGNVLTRRAYSSVTGLAQGVSTVVTLADGRVLEEVRSSEVGIAGPEGPTEMRDTHYLPYRRPNGAG